MTCMLYLPSSKWSERIMYFTMQYSILVSFAWLEKNINGCVCIINVIFRCSLTSVKHLTYKSFWWFSYVQWWESVYSKKTYPSPYLLSTWLYINFHQTFFSYYKYLNLLFSQRILENRSLKRILKYWPDVLKKKTNVL